MLEVEEHDDHEEINVTTLRYEDVDSPTEKAALEIFFRTRMTWLQWSLVVDGMQKVFKGDYVDLLFDVVMAVTPTKLKYIGRGRLYDPRVA